MYEDLKLALRNPVPFVGKDGVVKYHYQFEEETVLRLYSLLVAWGKVSTQLEDMKTSMRSIASLL